MITNLASFIADKIYLDYQVEKKKTTTTEIKKDSFNLTDKKYDEKEEF